jgi:hypothetical protein
MVIGLAIVDVGRSDYRSGYAGLLIEHDLLTAGRGRVAWWNRSVPDCDGRVVNPRRTLLQMSGRQIMKCGLFTSSDRHYESDQCTNPHFLFDDPTFANGDLWDLQGFAASNVLQKDGFPVSYPCLNQRVRCAAVP